MSDSAITITVVGTGHDIDATPVSVHLDSTFETTPTTMTELQSGRTVPCQLGADDLGSVLTWIERVLRAGESRRYRLYTSSPPPVDLGDRVELVEGSDRLDVLFDSELFTSYRLGGDGAHRPYFHPVLGPHGEQVTRSFPMVTGVPGETTDHPHHRGIWSAHGAVNSVDNWLEADGAGYTIHCGFQTLNYGPVYGRAVAVADWLTSDRETVLLRETRDMSFYDLGQSRIIDVDLTLTAGNVDVLFGDTKEAGTIALRVASTIDEVRGGRVENAEGAVGEADVFGRRSPWCDYSGPVSGRTVGVALFDHDENFRHPTNWHARDYGLLGANPFGRSVYEGPDHNGDHKLPARKSLKFKHRVYIHEGDATEARVAERFRDYVDPPRTHVEQR
ncbi:MAG: PmoA family protein [Vicinamibacterales bacterium]|jgi:hypothetical protein|nr:PmoA family protein [Vicinamibacterales bacterium]